MMKGSNGHFFYFPGDVDYITIVARKDRKIRMSYLSYDLAMQRSEDRGIVKGV